MLHTHRNYIQKFVYQFGWLTLGVSNIKFALVEMRITSLHAHDDFTEENSDNSFNTNFRLFLTDRL